MRRAVLVAVLFSVVPGLGVWARARTHPVVLGPEVVDDAGARQDGPIDSVTELTEEGIRLFESGELVAACRRFSRALEHAPDSDVLRRNAARCFAQLGWDALRAGRVEEAMQRFGEGLSQTPRTGELLTGLGLAAVQAGRVEVAIDALERALRDRTDSDVSVLLARLYDQRDDPERAVSHLRQLILTTPDHPEARRLLEKIERERMAETGLGRAESAHFILKAPLDLKGDPGELAHTLEGLYAEVGARLGHRGLDKIVVIVYPERGFRSLTRSHGWVNAVFDGKIRLPDPALVGPPAELRRLLAHELTHAVVHDVARGRAPRWLQEGLAQHFEGVPDAAPHELPRGLSLAGLDALLTDEDGARARSGYGAAVWLVRDLIDRGGVDSIAHLLARLGSGQPVAGAVAAVYGVRLADLEAEWWRILGG